MWTGDFLGNGDGPVTNGPFANWPLTTTIFGLDVLHRNLTQAPPNARTIPSLMSDRAVATLLRASNLRDITWFVDAEFEGRHGATHNWVGGVMGDLANSPNDPSFFLHHAFIDCMWEQQRRGQANNGVDVRYAYPNDSRALGVGIVQPDGVLLRRPTDSHHWWANTMEPFGPTTNLDGLKEEYFQHYECMASPSCSQFNPDCGSPYLFCDRSTYRCAPKVRYGAPCGRFSSDICYNGDCCRGICRSSCGGRSTNQVRPPRPSNRPQAPPSRPPSRPQAPPPRPSPQAPPPRPSPRPQTPPPRPSPRPQAPPPRPSPRPQAPPPRPSPHPQRPPNPPPARPSGPSPSSPPRQPPQRPSQRPFFPNQFSFNNPFSRFFGNPFQPFGFNRFNNRLNNNINFFDPRIQRQFFAG